MALKGNDRPLAAGEIQRSAIIFKIDFPEDKQTMGDPRVACRAGQDFYRCDGQPPPAEMDGRGNVEQWRKACRKIKSVYD